MNMGSSSTASTGAKCKISMLWNWYTIDSCFISRSWHVHSKGQFAGTCIGCFLLVLSAQWLHRVAREYDAAIARRRLAFMKQQATTDIHTPSSNSTDYKKDLNCYNHDYFDSRGTWLLANDNVISNLLQPILYTLSHNWVWDSRAGSSYNAVYPTLAEHLVKAAIFTIQWGQSYVIMLMFMYYNGYIIISCILGALFGRMIFNYEPITNFTRSESESNDRKCCM
ncbi:high-affinity Cu transporter [Saccharomycopsis crataegensis]|uniref:Copper transport protein n=1 Tax=Saccharomycopsis crataegensis TaxID=43959 RepID=A0AAV5QFJ9_9ASCO|nr:high-affinity Cu transporter [Saccharomycopsis crataegensis]